MLRPRSSARTGTRTAPGACTAAGARAAALVPAAVLVLGVGVVVGAHPPAGTAATSLAGAAATPCVAVVVDTGTSTSSRCVPYRAGLTGLAVLGEAGYPVQLDKSGFVCRIAAAPQRCVADMTHYWGYWHRAPDATAWTFSNLSASNYQVHPGETEGWAYQNGASRQPANVAYAAISAAARATPSATAKARGARRNFPAVPLVAGLAGIAAVGLGVAGWRRSRRVG